MQLKSLICEYRVRQVFENKIMSAGQKRDVGNTVVRTRKTGVRREEKRGGKGGRRTKEGR